MRVVGFALLLLGLAAPHALAAPAGHGSCPSIKDDVGDTNYASDTALDLTAVDVDVTPRQVTATWRVVGQPDPMRAGVGRLYEVYFQVPEEGAFMLQASIGNGQQRYRLLTNVVTAGSSSASASSWRYVRDVTGRVGTNSVSIIAEKPRDLPLDGRGAAVFGRTWLTAGPEGHAFIASEDDSPEVRLVFGVRQACSKSRGPS
jgi:hypothetical protein